MSTSPAMDPVLIRAWLPLAPDVVEAGLSACVTSSAVFLPASWLVEGRDVDVGARVVVEVGSDATGTIARFAGVVGWRARDVDAGVGVFVGASIDGTSSALLARLARRVGAGARVQPPGSRGARAVNAALVDDTVAESLSSSSSSSAPSAAPAPPRRLGLFADESPVEDLDGVQHPPVPPAWADRAAELAKALAYGDDDDDPDATLAFGGADGFDDVRTTSGAVERPFANLLLDAGSDIDAFPDAPPPADDSPRPFEGQSTDVDLLGEISAADVIALNLVAEETRADTGGFGTSSSDPDDDSSDDDDEDDDDSDLPSMEAELVPDWEDDTPHGMQTTVTSAWVPPPSRLPSPPSWPAATEPLLQLVGASWSMSRRGQLGVEPLSWPAQGTRRMSGMGDIDVGVDDDADVFSPPPPPPRLGAAPGVSASPPDPFAAQITDPRLNVEGLVARHVRASHNDVFAAADIDVDVPPAHALLEDDAADAFASSDGSDPDITNDELRLPRLSPGLLSETPAAGSLRDAIRPVPQLADDHRSSDEGKPL